MPSLVLINPQLKVNIPFIDNPIFSGFPFYSLYNFLLAHGIEPNLIDSFSMDNGHIEKHGNYVSIGKVITIDLLKEYEQCDIALIHYSTFQRSGFLLNRDFKQLITNCSNVFKTVIIADLYDSTTNYIDYDSHELLSVLPENVKILKKISVSYLFELLNIQTDKKWELAGNLITKKLSDIYNRACEEGLIKDSKNGQHVYPFLFSIGCPYNCTFCASGGTKWIHRELSDIQKEIKQLKSLGVNTLFVLDQHANYDLKVFNLFLDIVETANLKLHFTNGLNLKNLDATTLAKLHKLVDFLYISPESCVESVRQRLKKPYSPNDIARAHQLLSKFNIPIRAHYIIDTPFETMRETNGTLKCAWNYFVNYNAVPYIQRYVSQKQFFATQKSNKNLFELFSPLLSKDKKRVAAYKNFIHKLNVKEHSKIIINVSYRCNNKCIFCSVADRDRVDGDLVKQLDLIESSAMQGIRLLDLDGGEPLLYPNLMKLIKTALKNRYSNINITTNGRLLSYEKYAETLSKIPKLNILISLHSHDLKTHEMLTRARGSFSQTVAGIKNTIKYFGNVGVNMTVTSKNYKHIYKLAKFVKNLGVQTFNIQYYTPFGEVDPSLAPPVDAIDYVRETIKNIDNLNINLINFLYCMAPDLADYMKNDFYKHIRKMMFVGNEIVNLADFLSSMRYKKDTCFDCEWETLCDGFWKYE